MMLPKKETKNNDNSRLRKAQTNDVKYNLNKFEVGDWVISEKYGLVKLNTFQVEMFMKLMSLKNGNQNAENLLYVGITILLNIIMLLDIIFEPLMKHLL